MAPPKAQRASDFFRQGRRDKTRPEQDGGGSHSPMPASDQGSDTEALQPPTGDISISETKMAAELLHEGGLTTGGERHPQRGALGGEPPQRP
ncbi:Hypothetical predicted protein [Pelobates cultripes]|uniref:Uncharacterized protein n=1 Tax=Pelobates cultripes TaxID=61616 RepID=A0AAD1RPJ0_PELCU|nr:Hypothetical predicted protein [Pelobates cultripes]